MISYKCGNILRDDAQVLVNPVNCVGIMGKGLALQFKKEYPENFKAYAKECKAGNIIPGKIFIYDSGSIFDQRYIVNFPTKKHWRSKSRLEDIELGLKDFVKKIKQYQMKSIAIPPLGCGLGGLEWDSVRHLIEREFNSVKDVDIRVYMPESKCKISCDELSEKRKLFLSLICLYKQNGIEVQNDDSIGLEELQELGYILEKSGGNLGISFSIKNQVLMSKGLQNVINDMEPQYFRKKQMNTGRVDIAIDLQQTRLFSIEHPVIKKASKILEGYESPFGIYLLTMVDWIGTNSKIGNVETLNKIKLNKKNFKYIPTDYQINGVVERLSRMKFASNNYTVADC